MVLIAIRKLIMSNASLIQSNGNTLLNFGEVRIFPIVRKIGSH